MVKRVGSIFMRIADFSVILFLFGEISSVQYCASLLILGF